MAEIEPIIAEALEVNPEASRTLKKEEDPRMWPVWGCKAIALLPKVKRDDK